MTTLNDFSVTDLFIDVLAAYYNKLLGGILRGEFSNSVVMTTDLILTDGDTPIQRLNCNGANRVVKVPAGAAGNHPFLIVNTSAAANTITIKSNDGVTTFATINQGAEGLMLPDGNGSYVGFAITAAGKALLDDADASAQRVTMGAVGLTDTQTLTNKRLTPRTGTATSSATPTINTDNVDYFSLTGQTVNITSMTTNLSGTPTEGQMLRLAITGTAARTIAWGAAFENGIVALPATTVTTQRLDVWLVWNSVTSKWRCMASGSA